MSKTKIIHAFAVSFVDSLIAKDVISQDFIKDIEILKNVFSDKHLLNELSLLSSKEVEIKNILEKILVEQISNEYLPFLQLIIKKGHAANLLHILKETEILLQEYYFISDAIVYSTKELTAAELEEVTLLLKNKFNKKFNLVNKIDETLISGIKIQYKDHIIDASLSGYLDNLKHIHNKFITTG
jgi:ATP synthase F1 delta subunit